MNTVQASVQSPPDPFAHLRLMTLKEVRALVPYTPQHIYRLERSGKFPRRLRVGENRVAWRRAEIEAWLASRAVVILPEAVDD